MPSAFFIPHYFALCLKILIFLTLSKPIMNGVPGNTWCKSYTYYDRVSPPKIHENFPRSFAHPRSKFFSNFFPGVFFDLRFSSRCIYRYHVFISLQVRTQLSDTRSSAFHPLMQSISNDACFDIIFPKNSSDMIGQIFSWHSPKPHILSWFWSSVVSWLPSFRPTATLCLPNCNGGNRAFPVSKTVYGMS